MCLILPVALGISPGPQYRSLNCEEGAVIPNRPNDAGAETWVGCSICPLLGFDSRMCARDRSLEFDSGKTLLIWTIWVDTDPAIAGRFGLLNANKRYSRPTGDGNCRGGLIKRLCSFIDFCGHTNPQTRNSKKKVPKMSPFPYFHQAHQNKNITRSTSEPRLLPRPIIYSSTVENPRPCPTSSGTHVLP
jgi:hypothetical protein